MSLGGKVAAVTGAGAGIGRAIARALASEGASVVVADVDLASAESVRAELESLGAKAFALEVDVRRPRDAAKMVEAALQRWGKLDILVNNAGIYPAAAIANITEKDWDTVLDVDLKGVFFCSQAAAKAMVSQRAGKIINIASIDGKAPGAGNTHYVAAKAGVIGLTKAFAVELAANGVRVNAVAPGWIGTPHLLQGERWKEAVKKIPVGRLGTPEDVAGVVVFLASEAADYITGEIVDVNGGLLMD